MSDKTIDEVTPDTNVTGIEKLPVSDGGVPKSMTVEQVKDFVLTKINALSDATDITVASDGVFIRQGNAMKPLSATTLASAIMVYAFGQSAVSSLTLSDTLVVKNGGVTKTMTVSQLSDYLNDALGVGTVDFDDYQTASSVGQTAAILFAEPLTGESWGTPKVANITCFASALANAILFDYISSQLAENALDEDNDFIVAVNETDSVRSSKLVRVGACGLGKGDVKGPSANTDGKIPQWNGANSKTLKDGLALVSQVTSGSSSTEVPTALAVWNVAGGKAVAPATNTANNIPQWNGENSKTLKDGLGVSTSIGSSPTNASLATEKAVADKIAADITAALATGVSPGAITTAIATAITTALSDGGAIRTQIDDCVKAPSSTTTGKIPVWSATSKKLDDGKSIVTVIGSSPTDTQIPTAKAVNDAIVSTDTTNLVKMTNTTTQGQIPKWSSTQKTFDYYGYSVNTQEISSNGSSSELATTNAIMTTVRKAVKVQTSAPSVGTSGYEPGQMIYNNGNTNPGLYINVGTSVSSAWVRLAPVS